MKQRFKTYNPHKGQSRFHKLCDDPNNKIIFIVSAIRSGKSTSLIYQIIKDSWNNKSGFANLVCAPVYRQLVEVLECPIVDILSNNNLLLEHSYSAHKSILKNGNIIYYRSLENFDVIRGLNTADIFVDECALASKEAIEVLYGRLLTNNSRIVFATTPKGLNNWVYEDYFAETSNKKFVSVRYALSDNPSITQEAIDRLRESMDPMMCQQELDAMFVNLTQNRVYHAFTNDNIVSSDTMPEIQFNHNMIGLDYNIGKMSAVLMRKHIQTNKIYVIDEIYGPLTVQDMAQEINRRGWAHSDDHDYTIVDDASGNTRQQGSAMTNRQVLMQCGLGKITGNTSNPLREKRFNVVNSTFLNGLRKNNLFVSSKCKILINELQTLSYKKGTEVVDDRSNMAGHITDALGYCVYFLCGGVIIR
jgi:PBSX family phage terminase large subunit